MSNIKLILIICLNLSLNIYAMNDDEPNRLDVLEEQINYIRKNTNFNNHDAMLVLGVQNQEHNFNERFSGFKNIIFADFEQEEQDSKSLSLDFNNIEELTLVADKLESCFAIIILDDETYKFTYWTKNHLELFKKLLCHNGKFIFGPEASLLLEYTEDQEDIKDFSELGRHVVSKFPNELITGYHLPEYYYDNFANSNFHEEEINKINLIVKNIRRQVESQAEFKNMLRENKIHFKLYRDNILSDHDMRDIIIRQKFEDIIFEEILSHNWLPVIESVFGNNINISYNESLLFKSNHYKTQRVLITAQKC